MTLNFNVQSPMSSRSRQSEQRGFSLIVTVVMMILLSVIAIGLLNLTAVTIRGVELSSERQRAQANARLALSMALGQLQKHLGPDQRVSAPSAILEERTSVEHPHWVGVWRTTQEDGSSYYVRDDQNGGLRDLRAEQDWQAEEEVLSYLVSGNEGGSTSDTFWEPFVAADQDEGWVTLVGAGSLGLEGDLIGDSVQVPTVPVEADGALGSYGFWVGDLGVKANIATTNPWIEGEREVESFYGLMASQQAEVSALGSVPENRIEEIDPDLRARLASDLTANFVTRDKWVQSLWHDVTTWSQGVLSDTRDGGLKKNLTAYLEPANSGEDSGEVEPSILDTDNLVGPRNAEHAEWIEQDWESSRHQTSAPTFGLLRDWVQNSAGLKSDTQELRNSETVSIDSTDAGSRSAFANDEIVMLTKQVRSDLKPVVVEGSMYSTFSYHLNPRGFSKTYNVRFHQWPRVVLWNPYSVAVEVSPSVMMLQLNSRNDFRTGIRIGSFETDVQWRSWGGGTRTPPPEMGESITDSDNYNDPYSGMRFFSLPSQVIGPGECLVYTAKEAVEYDNQNILNNELSAEVAPDPSRNFYISSTEFDEDDTGSGFDFEIVDYFYNPIAGFDNQGDDARMIWKDATGQSSVGIFDFDDLPQLSSVSCSLQYGAGKEPRVAWNEDNRIPVEFTALQDPVVSQKPDVRSREGFRLRWFEEHPSNTGILNNPVGEGVFETAPLANWNLRASYSLRSPWSNVGGDVGDELASGPWFFGAYTRDLYDQLVGWDEQLPFFEEGLYRGNPFGPPQEGLLRNVLFDVPREETGVLSLAQFQHAKLSELIWHPSYAVGNSLVDPRLGTEGVQGTAPSILETSEGGWGSEAIGWSRDTERSEDRDEWARFARFVMSDLPEDENLVYDLSFELNHTLWDEFFLSSGSREQRADFIEDGKALPNGRMKPFREGDLEDVHDVDRAASALLLDGAFNVNSTSVEAWKALLSSSKGSILTNSENVLIPRYPQSDDGEYESGIHFADDQVAWAGQRSLSEAEIESLAIEIVEQVKARGPFLSLSDFVNRRLQAYETFEEDAVMGPLQAAIENAGLNSNFTERWELDNDGELTDYNHPDNIKDATRISQTLKPNSKAWGAPGYLTQADVLQVIGPVLTARSDTFVIRCYGDSRDARGVVQAQAWCEAVVQRTPEPLAPDEEGLNPDMENSNGKFGRKFMVRSLRWLSEEEV